MHYILALIFSFFLLGCGSSTSPTSQEPASAPSGPISIDQTPQYTEYADRITGRGRASVLFFSSKQDPFSIQSDRLLLSLYSSGSAKISTYRVDIDTVTGAKIRFGVFVPDTFVLIDAGGSRVGALVHPTQAELRTLVTTASFPK